MRKVIFASSWLLLVAGAVFLWRGGSDYWQSVSAQKEQALQWDNQNVVAQSVDDSPVTRNAGENRRFGLDSVSLQRPAKRTSQGESLAKLSIPRLSTVLYVLEGTADQDLKRGPGHLEGSVMPGDEGNCVIAGHRDTHFRVLKDVVKGDRILVQSRQGTYTYKVTGLSVVPPTNTDSLKPTEKGVLNLITCFPFDYVGAAPRRFIVHADLVES